MKPIPRPSFLDQCEPIGARDGQKRWRSRDGTRIYTWDSLHGEIEVFNRRGRHLGVADALTGRLNETLAVKGRRIDV